MQNILVVIQWSIFEPLVCFFLFCFKQTMNNYKLAISNDFILLTYIHVHSICALYMRMFEFLATFLTKKTTKKKLDFSNKSAPKICLTHTKHESPNSTPAEMEICEKYKVRGGIIHWRLLSVTWSNFKNVCVSYVYTIKFLYFWHSNLSEIHEWGRTHKRTDGRKSAQSMVARHIR